MPEAGKFGTMEIGQSSPPVKVNLTFEPSTPMGSYAVLTGGATGQDYMGTATTTDTTVTVN